MMVTLVVIAETKGDLIKRLNDIEQQQHPFIDPLSGTTRVSQHQKGKINLN